MKTTKLITLLLFLAIFTHAQDHVVISQVYGGGGNSGAVYMHDYVELFNPTANDISLQGWSLHYASAAGTAWKTTLLTGTIPAGSFYLIRQASSGNNGNSLPMADDTGTVNIGATSGKVVLCNDTLPLSGSCAVLYSIIDLVGYGSSVSCYENSPAPAPSNAKSLSRRNLFADNNNNASDFIITVPDPHNSHSVTGLPETDNAFISVYPNPCADMLYIHGIPGTVSISTLTGRCVMAGKGAALDVSGLAAGMYVVEAGNVHRMIVKE